MPDTQSMLLQAVLDAPADDTPRLAYADWCSKQADAITQARAQFIRTQVAMAREDFTDLPSLERSSLIGEAGELRAAHGAVWAGPLAPLVDAYGFQRGFVNWVRLSAVTLLTRGNDLFALAPIQHMDLTRVRDANETLFSCEHLRRLRSLSLDACGLYDLHLQVLADSAELPVLHWLSLADNHLGIAGAEALALAKNMPALRFAEFRGNPFDPCEQQGFDSGVLVSSWMPPEGVALEASHGVLPWLHRDVPVQRYA